MRYRGSVSLITADDHRWQNLVSAPRYSSTPPPTGRTRTRYLAKRAKLLLLSSSSFGCFAGKHLLYCLVRDLSMRMYILLQVSSLVCKPSITRSLHIPTPRYLPLLDRSHFSGFMLLYNFSLAAQSSPTASKKLRKASVKSTLTSWKECAGELLPT